MFPPPSLSNYRWNCLTKSVYHIYNELSLSKDIIYPTSHIKCWKGKLDLDFISQQGSEQLLKSTLIYTYLTSELGCSKLKTSLVDVSLKFQRFISQICQYFLLKKM